MNWKRLAWRWIPTRAVPAGAVASLLLSLLLVARPDAPNTNVIAAPRGAAPSSVRSECLRIAPISDASRYCDVVDRTIRDLDEFWKRQYPAIRGVGRAYVPPSRFLAYSVSRYFPVRLDIHPQCQKRPDALAGSPASYCLADMTLVRNEAMLAKMFEILGNSAPVTVLAHEWGHHLQLLLGLFSQRLLPRYTIQLELEADCFAGVYSKHAAEVSRLLNPTDYRSGVVSFYYYGDRNLPWFDDRAHGQPQQRVLAFLLGYRLGPHLCAAWLTYAGQPVLTLGKYLLAVYPDPGATVERLPNGGTRLKGRETTAEIAWLPDLSAQPASTQMTAVATNWLGSSMLLQGEVAPPEEIGGGTAAALRYRRTRSSGRVHGILYLHVLSRGGGIVIDVYADSPAFVADWTSVERALQILLLGLEWRS